MTVMLTVPSNEKVPIRLAISFGCVQPHRILSKGAVCRSEEVPGLSV